MRRGVLLLLATCLMATASAQTNDIVVSGSVQSDVLIPQEDETIGAEKDGDWAKTNTYIDLQAQSKYVDAGLRFEYLQHPLPGFEPDFAGWGVRHYWVKGKLDKAELTLGAVYDQFGSGLIFRTYEERSLGVDNSLLGGRLVVQPLKGVTIKALTGKQRRYWHYNDSWITGADAEVELFSPHASRPTSHALRLTLGASWVNKHEDQELLMTDATHRLNFPEYVNAWDVRANLHSGNWSVLAEYAGKTQDPSTDNGFIYRNGSAALLSASYSKKGLSLLAQVKRSEDMSFRSKRMGKLTSSYINYLPAFTEDHTYALPALYPYATQLAAGEWAYQATLGYKFKRKTVLGGRYGMDLKAGFSYVRAIDHEPLANGGGPGTEGYHSSFMKWGDDTYYQDLNIQLTRRLTRDFRLSLMYMNQHYNMLIVEGHGEMVKSHIFVADGKYQFSPKTALRGELQYLTTRQDEGDWAFGLLELSLAPHWMVTVSDQWNCGESDIHYYQGLVTFAAGAHRLQAGYGRVQAGYNCSGGVCRYVPAYKGFTLSYNYNF